MKTSLITKIFFLITFIIFSFFNFERIKVGKAGNEHNVSGWAWSDNIGWISFNSNTDPGSSYNYGVNINPLTGQFSGYAWSDHIGWIDFAPSGPYPDSPNYSACLDLQDESGELCDDLPGNYLAGGWARTVNTGDGWDGWIILRDDTVYADGVSYNKNDDQLEGWAWSDDIGWISFNNSTYGVVTGINSIPTAIFSCDPAGCCACDSSGCGVPADLCTGYTKRDFTLLNNSTDPDGEDDIASSTWVITGPSPERRQCFPVDPTCDWTLPSTSFAGDYTATLKVEDLAGVENTSPSQSFKILNDAVADFMCSLNQTGPWNNCNLFKILEGEVVYFLDNSDVSEGGGSIIQRDWEFGGGDPGLNFGNETIASTTFIYSSDPNFGDVTLTIEDQAQIIARINSKEYDLSVKAPPPEWKEVSPF